jgi:hypothetical protein
MLIVKTYYFMEGGDDDHGKLSQRNKKHHQTINDNLHHDSKRFTLIIVIPFLTQGINVLKNYYLVTIYSHLL